MSVKTVRKVLLLIVILYLFILSIQLMGASFKLMGKGLAETLIRTTSNPVVGLLIGILATSVIQSSSTTTSITVSFVAGGVLTLPGAIPIIMGANIGTTITNTIVSMGHVTRKHEFQRAFAASVVHDFFNVLAVILLFPLEMIFHPIERAAGALSSAFVGFGAIELLSPIAAVTKPAINLIIRIIPYPVAVLVGALLLLFIMLIQIVKIMRSLVLTQIELFLDKYLFKNDLTAFLLAMAATAVVQSSSITTSLVVPLAGAGVLTTRKIFPYTLGSNIGTTVTAMLAAFATLNPVAITVAFAHLVFNIFGIALIYPFKKIPIWLADNFAKAAVRSRKNVFIFVLIYFAFYLVPLAYFLFIR